MVDFSFKLSDDFVNKYIDREVDWGFRDAGGNSIGELTFIRTYARVKEDGTKEKWWEVCRRVIEGMYTIQKDYVKHNRLPWNDNKAQSSAKEAFDRMFTLKWTPPGRGLWVMGSDFVMKDKNGAALQNCAFVSTGDIDKNDPGDIFAWVMDALMLGIGVGWDTKAKDRNVLVNSPKELVVNHEIADSREGWTESARLLINSYLKPGQPTIQFDYSKIRLEGEPIKGFGGTASGPKPLIDMHERMSKVLSAEVGNKLGSRSIADLMNLIGTCVVAGNIRRSAELALGQPDDEEFINLKNSEVFPERNSYDPENPGWGWMSNNSLDVKVGQDYSKFVDLINNNGEPGFAWMDVTRDYGRLIDPPNFKDHRAVGYNPCAEQSLESFECCTLVEVHINRAESKEDFLRTLKFAYLYAKTVTLMNTHWAKTNAVMQRNRRIGTSITGLAGFNDNFGLPTMRTWLDEGYSEVQKRDKQYSEWLGVRQSIKTTSVKPSGSVSLLSGATPGVHWAPGGKTYLRAIRFSENDLIVPLLLESGYRVEPDLVSSGTVVAYFPIKTDQKRGEAEVSIFEKINLAAEAQAYWSDNSVSVTISFDANREKDFVDTVIKMYEGKVKTLSFLPMGNAVYPQQPYTSITEEEYQTYVGKLNKFSTDPLYNSDLEAEGDRYCTTDRCMIPELAESLVELVVEVSDIDVPIPNVVQ